MFIHPVILGAGKTIFSDSAKILPLKLMSSTSFSTGVVHLRYQKR
ncbi:dihydrofolate reductase family protein [Shimazuella alba]|uniref:Bacterial bifunctional deaminase-reductase C-terminal domain-containing protein n=1 Tax=Shimazuella alba TaxID=2690964 RepID=A0A6I4VWU8_9BACL|nr:hypothetical protein [Shimazuella alba]